MPKIVTKSAVKEESYIVCDACGEICENNNFMDLFAAWGYGSKHDLETWNAFVCESCVMFKLNSFIKFNKDERSALE